MSATLRTSAIQRRRKRQEKRRKLRRLLARAAGAERSALETKLLKTYPLVAAEQHTAAHPPKRG